MTESSPESVAAVTGSRSGETVVLHLLVDGKLREFRLTPNVAAALGKALFDALGSKKHA